MYVMDNISFEVSKIFTSTESKWSELPSVKVSILVSMT